jgi:hypothetical protein
MSDTRDACGWTPRLTNPERIAVLADVHGNLPALEAVLGEVDSEAFDLVVSAGDQVSGPMPAECLDHDGGPQAAAADRWAGERLRADQRELIARFEPTVTIGDLLVCHGTPAGDEEMVTVLTMSWPASCAARSPPPRRRRRSSPERMRR